MHKREEKVPVNSTMEGRIEVDMEDKAIPEIHLTHGNQSGKMPENDPAEEIDYSGAIPEIHFGARKK